MMISDRMEHSSSLAAEDLDSTSFDALSFLSLSSDDSSWVHLSSFSLSDSVVMLSWECLGGVRLVWDDDILCRKRM